MHGRIKVRTTEEEKQRKKKEQSLKVKAYRAAMTKITTKRQLDEYDNEMLQITSQILLRNPDLTTMWNLRRMCVERIAKELQETEPESAQSVFDTELGLTEQCLMVNPKSYGGWHHRCWTLERSPLTNWDREVQLCNKYLKMDERNFHTWDYRRYVVAKAGVSKEQELDFCTDKIKTNFSNYSSWHYRSQLLPELYPYEGDTLPKRPMSEAKLKEELEMVLTAAFTDPNDSSAWFYQRWLLGYSRQELDICAFRCDKQKAVVAFTNPIDIGSSKITIQDESGDNRMELANWLTDAESQVSATWLASLPSNRALNLFDNDTYQLQLEIPNIGTRNLQLQTCHNGCYYFNPPNRSFAFSAAVLEELQTQLESCENLLEYEPDSKWTLLTSALLMRAIDCEKYHSKSLEYLEKLQKIDFLREGYYRELASKWILEKLLMDWSQSANIPKKLDVYNETQLTSICYTQYFCIADKIALSEELKQTYSNLKTFDAFQV